VVEEKVALVFTELMNDAHPVQELSRLLLGAAQLHHAVSDGHDLREDNLVHASHGVGARLSVEIVPGLFGGNRLQLFRSRKGKAGAASERMNATRGKEEEKRL